MGDGLVLPTGAEPHRGGAIDAVLGTQHGVDASTGAEGLAGLYQGEESLGGEGPDALGPRIPTILGTEGGEEDGIHVGGLQGV